MFLCTRHLPKLIMNFTILRAKKLHHYENNSIFRIYISYILKTNMLYDVKPNRLYKLSNFSTFEIIQYNLISLARTSETYFLCYKEKRILLSFCTYFHWKYQLRWLNNNNANNKFINVSQGRQTFFYCRTNCD